MIFGFARIYLCKRLAKSELKLANWKLGFQFSRIIYKHRKSKKEEEIASILLIGGPKANLEEHGILEYRAEVENEFVSCGENPDGC